MSVRKKRVLFIIWSFSYGGGAERVLSYLIAALDRTGRYEIDLLEVCHVDIAWEPLPETVKVHRPVIDETADSFWGRARRFVLRRLIKLSPAVVRMVTRGRKRYDAVIAFNYQLPSFLVRPKEASISWNHGSIECLAEDPRGLRRQKRAYARMDRIVAIAERTRSSIVGLFPEVESKCEIIYNGFPVDAILARAQESCGIVLEPRSLVAIGRLDDNKRPELILEAFKSIALKDSLAHLYYIGEGAHEDEVRRLAMESDLGDRVHFLGYQQNPYPIISQASCIISMSESEGFQSVFIEGLLFGVPFISTPAGAAEELSGGGLFGRVIYDPKEAAEAFSGLMCKSDVDRARMYSFAASFSPERQVAELERIIEEITREEP